MNKKQFIQQLKGRLDIIALIDQKVDLQVQTIKEAQEKAQESGAALLDAKLQPFERLLDQIEIIKAEIAGLTLEATEGADARARVLEGRLRVLQQEVLDFQQGQGPLLDSLLTRYTCIEKELRLLQEIVLAPPDTVIQVDTLTVKKKHWLKRIF